MRACLARSLGPPETYETIYSRPALMRIAAQRGIRIPVISPATSESEAVAWRDGLGGPVVLKTDGSWGGRGVEVVHDSDDVAAAWRRLAAPPDLAQIVKRLLRGGVAWPLRDRISGRRPAVSIQAYVPGRPANVAVSCRDGEVISTVVAEVVVSTRSTGPATVLKVVDSPEMAEAAASIVQALRLSGLCGFDFVLEKRTGRAHLIELNPRATPTAHLLTADGCDPLRSLAAAMRDAAPPCPRTPYTDGLVALFPQELERDPDRKHLASAHHDIPANADDFVARVGRRPEPLREFVGALVGRSRPSPHLDGATLLPR